MTDTTETVEPEGVSTETSSTNAVEDVDTDGQQDDQQPDDNKEAARYRHRAKAAEAERDKLAERVVVMQRGEAERLAASKLADPQDLWRDGAQLVDVLDDAGHLDPVKLDGLIGTVLGAHKHWARQQHPGAARASDVTSNGKIGGGDTSRSWAQVLNPEREGE
jgi:hypothetical protein